MNGLFDDRNHNITPEAAAAAARRNALLSALRADCQAASGNPEAIRAVVRAYPDVVAGTSNTSDGTWLLHWLCENAGAAGPDTAATMVGLASFIANEWPQALRERGAGGFLPLHAAVSCSSPNLELVRALVAAGPGAALLDRARGGSLPLHLAMLHRGSADAVRLLIAAGPQALRERNSSGSLPLHLAAEFSTRAVVECVSDAWPGALREADGLGGLPLHRAAESRIGSEGWSPDVPPERLGVAQLLARRYRPALRAKDKNGWLPLHVACRYGSPAVAGILAREWPRALRRRTRAEGWVPLHILAQKRFATEQIARVLMIADLWPHGLRERDAKGWLPLHYAAQDGPLEVAEHFALCWPLSVRTATSDTKDLPLHVAAFCADVELVRYLADAFPSALHARNADGQLPLHRCVSRGNPGLDVVRLLGSAFPGALREKDKDGLLPLHHAASKMSLEAVRYLAGESAHSLLQPTNDGRLPLHCAAKQHHASRLDVIQFFAEAEPLALQIPSSDGSLPLHLAAASFARALRASAIERLAHAWPRALDVCDGRGMRPVHVAATHDAPLDAIYVLARMDPNAVLRHGPDVRARASSSAAAAAAAAPHPPRVPTSVSPGEAAAAARCTIL
jgi:ankyrin repeat protein